jgi:all-trans-8'-apo-beta-carotenal 15,15'-oxygenase
MLALRLALTRSRLRSLQMTALALDGTTQSVRVTSRLVETPRLAAQRAAGDAAGFPLRGAWTQATQWHRNIFGIPTNPSNTSVLRWAGKLMALCEGGAPMELDPETLATRGPVVFSGQERQLAVLGFNAHFKIDPEDGVLYNCGVQLPSSLRVFALGPDGRERAATAVNFSAGELAFVHDWAMSARHLVLFIPPWVCAPLDALAAVAGLRALGHAFAWRAGRGTRCVVLRKADLAIVHDSEIADAFSGYHFCNAWEEGALLKVHVNRLIGTRDALEANFSAMYDAVWRVRRACALACRLAAPLACAADAARFDWRSARITTSFGSTPSTWRPRAGACWAARPCYLLASMRSLWSSLLSTTAS